MRPSQRPPSWTKEDAAKEVAYIQSKDQEETLRLARDLRRWATHHEPTNPAYARFLLDHAQHFLVMVIGHSRK
jgi:hypothetical protein